MPGRRRASNQITLFGCGPLLVVVLLLVAAIVAVIIVQGRQVGHYPQAELLPDLSELTIQPFFIQSKLAYRSSDSFVDVQLWYEQQLDLPAREPDLASGCKVLEGIKAQTLLERYVFVTICETQGIQKIVVFFKTSFKLSEGAES